MDSEIPVTQLFPLDAAAVEVIFAPLHDPQIAPTLDVTSAPQAAHGFRHEFFWCWTAVKWDGCPADAVAGTLTLRCRVPTGRFDRLITAVNLPADVSVSVEIATDEKWQAAGAAVRGKGARFEPEWPLPAGTLTGVRLTFHAHAAGPRSVAVSWFGLADSDLRKRSAAARLPADPAWSGLIKTETDWGAPSFGRDLFFAAADLPALREKKTLPGWREHWAVLETRAQRFRQRSPEDDLGEYLPWSDIRYLREREQGREPYFWQALTVSLVGLVNDDRELIRHALRYLMCLVHSTHWCQSAESRLRGSTWDQRCFVEEMAVTSCATLLDWFGWALTPRAHALVRQAIWDKGLAIIERDMMKFAYLLTMNQGPWFCRARVLGGLMLENAWPRVGQYVERAVADLREGLDHYILPDGGTDEGIGYWSVTMTAALPALLAYGRARQVDPRTLLPAQFAKSEQFLAIMSAVKPGRVSLDGDNSTDYLTGETIPILAGWFAQSHYARLAATCLAQERPFTYFQHYLPEGVFGFIAGPAVLAPAESIVPTFGRLELTGQLTSRRAGVRLHVTGCKANPSHSHRDKGAFTLELDGEPVLIDRGTVRYDDARAQLLHRSALHNILTPVLAGNVFPDQAFPTEAVIPQGQGDERTLQTWIDPSHVWREHMEQCRREIRSDSPEQFVVRDWGRLKSPGRVAFHLQAREPFVIEGCTATLPGKLRIEADWAEMIAQEEDLIDFQFAPVHHLVIRSRELTEFALVTEFTC